MVNHDEIRYLDQIRSQELIDEIKARLATKQNIFQYTTMPTPSSANLGLTYQYTGADTEDYKNGDFYKVVYDAENTEYKYEKRTYNKEEIDALIDAAGHFVVVDELPTTDIKTNVIYLVPQWRVVTGYEDSTNDLFYYPTGTIAAPAYAKFDDEGAFVENVTGEDAIAVAAAIEAGTYTLTDKNVQLGSENNIKDEYINLDGTTAGWEKIGSTELDLSDYVRFEDLVPITSSELTDMWKDNGVLTLDKNSVSVAVSGTDDVVVSAHSGTVSVESDDTDVATVAIVGTTITVTGVAAGSATVTVTSAATADYREATATISVTVA